MGHVEFMEQMGDAYRTLLENSKVERLWKDNVIMDVKKQDVKIYAMYTGFNRHRLGSTLNCSDHDNEPLGFIKVEFIIKVQISFKVSFGSNGSVH